MKLPISLVVIAKNEEKKIAQCIESAHFLDDVVVVVDQSTTDGTAEIAKQKGARVFIKEWQGFGPQKRWAVEQAKNDWVLCLDADERISEEMAEELREKFPHLDPETKYYFPLAAFYMGRWIWHGGWFPDFKGRLFHRKYYQWDLATIHERVVGGAKMGHFLGPIEHYVFDHFSDHIETNIRYARLLADADEQK
ncbi:MAG: glycosyltransferase family 2 protein, partial [Bdellovibrionaceae bacterium]|nr:glycosyltransferase family 2 protein [Pseudobdellovibrionaceae bacterium]MDW8190392.1 glycosyltransferase family 2 protein [Pseudobdellovibrionaceae bacterium]